MNTQTELKILKAFIDIINDPTKAERKFKNYAMTCLTLAMVFLFYCFSSDFETLQNKTMLAALGFGAGTALGLGIWFLQAATQTRLMVRYMMKDAISSRIAEINPDHKA